MYRLAFDLIMSSTFSKVSQLRISRHYCCLQLQLQLEPATLNHLLKKSIHFGQLNNAMELFRQNPLSRNVVSWNIIIAGCVKCRQLQTAHQLFVEMPQRDIVSWNTWLSALQRSRSRHHLPIYRSYLQLLRSGLRPSAYTFSILVSSSIMVLIPQLHTQVISLGHYSSVFVASALLRGYTKLGHLSALHRVFDDTLHKNICIWNSLIMGYMDLGLSLQAQTAFNMMPHKDVVSWTAMVDGYLKNKQVKKARYIFDQIPEKNIVSWTAMISGYVRTGNYLNALDLFLLMSRSNTRANQHTFSSILAACAGRSDVVTGEQVHASLLKHGVPIDVVLSTALVDMYAKCGNIEAAYCIFETIPNKTLASWNSIIGGHARNGLARRALDDFQKMTSSGLKPNHVTFINVLSACGHAGLVEEGEMIFCCMEKGYGLKPEKEHYACMVDLYGRAGHLDKAKRLIEWMPFEPDVIVWSALLGACGLHCNSEFSGDAAGAIHNLEKDHPAVYSTFAKILGEKGVWSTLSQLKSAIRAKHVKKQKAGSRLR